MTAYEKGSTAQFDMAMNVDTTPQFIVRQHDVIVASFTAQSSGNGNYYALFAPETEGAFVAEWRGVKTMLGSAYNVIHRFAFYVTRTRA